MPAISGALKILMLSNIVVIELCFLIEQSVGYCIHQLKCSMSIMQANYRVKVGGTEHIKIIDV